MYSLSLSLYADYERRTEKAQRKGTFFRFTFKKNYLCLQKQFNLTNMIIAVDFDGTIVEHRYPGMVPPERSRVLCRKQGLSGRGHRQKPSLQPQAES